MKFIVQLTAIVLALSSCKNSSRFHFAIKDFRKSLQPHLIKLVNDGTVVSEDSALRNMATDVEIKNLSNSEHPVLRATALREMLYRKSFNHFDVVMNNLDDKAIIFASEGEFYDFRSISDDVLLNAKWKTKEDKNKTIDKVLTQHNYLRSAYYILPQLEPQEKYYSIIKNMATNPSQLINENSYKFKYQEQALYALAKYKKQENIQVINKILNERKQELTKLSFEIIKNYPDTAYLALYNNNYINFYANGTKYWDKADEDVFALINSIASYKSDKSAAILNEALIFEINGYYLNEVKELVTTKIVEALRNYNCKSYKPLIKQTDKKHLELKKQYVEATNIDSNDIKIIDIYNNSDEKINWITFQNN